MTTKVKKQKAAKPSRTALAARTEVPAVEAGITEYIAIGLIDISPLNYRKYYDQETLESFALELAIHGIISSVTLRKMETGRYELVTGERRYRAAQLAGIDKLPAIIRVLTDQEVGELQLAENIQRENPHPLHEAQAIAQMQQHGFSIEEIAARLGKSKNFIYGRIKLAGLIEPLQEMFFLGKFSIQEAFDIASISETSQQEFFDEYCKGWKKKEFRLYNLNNLLSKFRYDLKRAPFNTKDKDLLADVGACTKCPFNSAVLKTLFPEMAKEAICTNKSCYQQKCTVNLQRVITKATEESQPVALINRGSLSEVLQGIIKASDLLRKLPVHDWYDITVFSPPQMPDKEDFRDTWSEEDEPEFDEDGFNQAVQEYQTDLEEYNLMKESGKASIGLYIYGNEAETILFSTEKQKQQSGSKGGVSAKQVQEAIKAGTVTSELLEGEISRLQSREQRSKEIDRDKVQLKVHEQFSEQYGLLENNATLTDADLTAARLIILDSMNYHSKNEVIKILFGSEESFSSSKEETYAVLKALTDQQYAYLIRMALAAKSDSKFPNNETAYTLYQVAENAGLNVQAIEQEQQVIMESREVKLKQKLGEIQIRLEKFKVPA